MKKREALSKIISEVGIPGLKIAAENSMHSGANHSIIKLEGKAKTYALKLFTSSDKFCRELFFLRHCRNQGIKNVPRLIRESMAKKEWILMEWIEGEMLKIN